MIEVKLHFSVFQKSLYYSQFLIDLSLLRWFGQLRDLYRLKFRKMKLSEGWDKKQKLNFSTTAPILTVSGREKLFNTCKVCGR